MRRSVQLSIAAIACGSIAFGIAPITALGGFVATPVACEEGDVTPDGRVFPEPLASVTYLTFAEFECGTALLVQQHPDRMRVDVLLESAPGVDEEVYDVVLTDSTVPAADKQRLLVMSSIHGDEIGPREGAARQIEDLLTGRNLAGLDVDALLAQFEVHWVFPNPSGWADGEGAESGNVFGTYTRSQDGGTDLNRNFPVQGYFAYNGTDYFTPEGTAIKDLLVEGFEAELAGDSGGWGLGTDNHGQLVDSYLAAGLQIVGQFDYQKSETIATFADRIDDEMANFISTAAFAEFQLATQQAGMDKAGGYRWGTLYDILGYSASGSGIDYYNTLGQVEGVGFATEVTAGKQLAANRYTYSGVLNQLWVDSIRAINMAMFKEALAPAVHTFELVGDVAFVLDPTRITDTDANLRGAEINATNPGGHDQAAYDVSKYDFFADLAGDADHDVVGVLAEDLATTDLSGFAAVVLTETEVLDRSEDPAAAAAALRAYAEAGGTLIVTDEGLQLLPALTDDAITAADVSSRNAYVGAVQEFVGSDGMNAGLRGIASQTYDTVPIGFAFPGSGNAAPNWLVDTGAFEGAGGTTAGISKIVTFDALGHAQIEQSGSEATIYGELPLGEGRVRILGALLPDPTEEFYHPFGLQDYAVTYTGYTLLQNMINAR
jgi:hypothetical protein